jgi:phospholipid transport system substrate-binding protein
VLTRSFPICGKPSGVTKTPSHRVRILWTLVLITLLLIQHTPPATAGSEDAVRQFVEQVNSASNEFFFSESEADAREKCRSLLSWAFDVQAMAEYALAKAWDTATGEERKAFLEAFEDEIVTEYLRRMKANGTLTYIGAREPLEGDRLAASRLTQPGKPAQTWIWRIRPAEKAWRIVDVLVDGHSAIFAGRQQYAQILEDNHGDINAVIAFVRERAARGLQSK